MQCNWKKTELPPWIGVYRDKHGSTSTADRLTGREQLCTSATGKNRQRLKGAQHCLSSYKQMRLS